MLLFAADAALHENVDYLLIFQTQFQTVMCAKTPAIMFNFCRISDNLLMETRTYVLKIQTRNR